MMKNAILAGTLLVAALIMTPALSYATGAQAPAQPKPYTEINLRTSDAKAVSLATKLLAEDLALFKETASKSRAKNKFDIKVFASFIQLGPDKPKDAIVAFIEHPTVTCGSSGCRVYILMPVGNNTYRKVLTSTVGRLFYNHRPGQEYYDLLGYVMPRRADGFGVQFWDEKLGKYKFVGISKFKKAQ